MRWILAPGIVLLALAAPTWLVPALSQDDKQPAKVRQIEREKLFAVTRESHVDLAVQFIGIKGMRRLAELEHHKVRDVDDVINRADPSALDLGAQPLRARPDLYIIDLARGKEWALSRRGNG